MKRLISALLVVTATLVVSTPQVYSTPPDCEKCHIEITPKQVADFNRGKMAETMTCAGYHGDAHNSKDDVSKALLPTGVFTISGLDLVFLRIQLFQPSNLNMFPFSSNQALHDLDTAWLMRRRPHRPATSL